MPAGRSFDSPAGASGRQDEYGRAISIGVIPATLLSLFETLQSGEHAYFDASTTLLFFLLVGRTLDHLMRARAQRRNQPGALAPRGAVRVLDDGGREYVALGDIEPGMLLELRAGDRVPVDATVVTGTSVLDCHCHRRDAAASSRSRQRADGGREQPLRHADEFGATSLQ
jgi:Cu2+-exporting ATPase